MFYSKLRVAATEALSSGSALCGGRRRTLLDDDGVQPQLHLSPLHDPLLHCVLRDEAEDSHLLLLTDPVGSVLRWGENGDGGVGVGRVRVGYSVVVMCLAGGDGASCSAIAKELDSPLPEGRPEGSSPSRTG